MTRLLSFSILAAASLAGSVDVRAQEAPRNDLPQPYRTTRDWGELPPGVTWAAVTAVEPSPDGSIYVIQMLERHVKAQPGGSSRTVTPAEYERWKKELSNWGRWGKDDQLGALNLVTPAKRRQAAALVKDGVSVSLAHDVDTEKAVDNQQPYVHEMVAIGADRFAVQFHGVAHTHLDSLAHINENGVFYNGYTPNADAVMKSGHTRNSIHNVKNGIVTRGILIDVPRLKGVPYLEPGTVIYPEDIEAFEKMAGVKVGPGDALFIRTGRWARRAVTGPFDTSRTGRRAGPIPRSSRG